MRQNQALVYAQGEVNSAVFLMNVQHNREHYPSLDDADIADQVIASHIRLAIEKLNDALTGFQAQQELFGR